MIDHAVIGSLMLWPEELGTALDILTPADFRNAKARTAFEAIMQHECTDPATISSKANLKFEELAEWQNLAGMQMFFKRQCQELKSKSQVHALQEMARAIMQLNDPSAILTLAEKRIAEISGRTREQAQTVKEVLRQVTKDLEHRYNNKGVVLGMTTGIIELDKVTTGGHPGELWIVAGRPGMGKSAFGVNVVEAAALAGHKSRIFSTEMKKGQLVERMLSSQGKVKFSAIRNGNFRDSDWGRISAGMEKMAQFPVYVDECPGLTLSEIKSRCRKQKRNGLDIVVIDYLQRMDISGDNRTRAVGEVSRALKDLAMELDIWIILLSQLNRSLESRPDKRPMMSDLRDSGEIEQDADVILFPFREAVYCQQCKDGKNTPDHDMNAHQSKAELLIEKQRNGAAPINIPAVWLKEFVKFENAEEGGECEQPKY